MATFDVRAFGAVGDGVTDDTAAIKRAIDACKAAGGGTIEMSAGTYIVRGDPANASRGPIELYSNMTLTGAGIGETVIKLADDFNARINGIVRTALETVDNVLISNLTIDGNRANNTGHQAGFICGIKEDSGKTQSNITLDAVEARNCTAYGINPHEITTNMVIRNSVAHDNGLDGFVADAVFGGTYANNLAYDNDRHGFNLQNMTRDLVLENNEARGNGSAGLTIQRGDIPLESGGEPPHVRNILVKGGEYHDNAKEGMLIKLSDAVTVDGASIHDNLRQGVRIEGSINTTVKNSILTNNAQEADNTYDEINIRLRLDDAITKTTIYSTGTKILDNTIGSTGAVNARYGIREEPTNDDGGATGTVATGNVITGMDSGAISIPNFTETGTSGNDVFYGTTGANTFSGLAGDDTYTVNHTGDVVIEAAGGGTDTVISSLNHTLAANVENLTLTGAAVRGTGNALANAIVGNAGNNELEGLGGDDVLDGGAGADAMKGGDGNDTYYVDNVGDTVVEKQNAGLGGVDTVISSVSFTLSDEVENLTLAGTASLDATGNSARNVLIGNAGNNVLNGLVGADTMEGKGGNDTYVVDNTGDVVIEASGAGIDTVVSSIAYVLGANVENLTLSGLAAINGEGNALANAITGNAAANRLHGWDGNDVLDGGAGADQLYGDAGNDVFVFAKGQASGDTIEDFDGKGAAAGDRIVLVGYGAGTKVVQGTGSTWTIVDGAASETITIKRPAGAAAVDLSDFSFADGAPVPGEGGGGPAPGRPPVAAAVGNAAGVAEDTTLSGKLPAATDPDGNAGLTYLLVSPVQGLALGADGSFTYAPPANFAGTTTFQYQAVDPGGLKSAVTDFVVTVSPVNDAPVAASLGNAATAPDGAVFSGRLPAAADPDAGDALTYVQVGSLAGLVLKSDGSFTYAAAPNASGIVSFQYQAKDAAGALSAVTSFALTIENRNDAPVAAASGNGASGNEDTVITGSLPAASDPDGDTGLTYHLVAAVQGLTLNPNGTFSYAPAPDFFGTASFQYQVKDPGGLLSQAQTFTITVVDVPETTPGGATITGTGGANTLNGTAGNDTIDGLSGADTMAGKAGDDTYYVDTSSDKVIELASQGIDTVFAKSSFTIAADSHVEILKGIGTAAVTLKGNDFANAITGNDAANTISGGGGNDRLDGGLGKDVLTGGAGQDAFLFSTALGGGNVDTIKDFVVRDDDIGLARAIFGNLGVEDLDPNAFVVGKAALDASDRIIYDKAAGALLFDADGAGGAAAIQFAVISPNLGITADDFFLF